MAANHIGDWSSDVCSSDLFAESSQVSSFAFSRGLPYQFSQLT